MRNLNGTRRVLPLRAVSSSLVPLFWLRQYASLCIYFALGMPAVRVGCSIEAEKVATKRGDATWSRTKVDHKADSNETKTTLKLLLTRDNENRLPKQGQLKKI